MVLNARSLHGLGAGYDGLHVGCAAHSSLPFGTELTVCYAGGCAYDVPVIDRGPYVYGRDLDVTVAVADEIGLTYAGVGLVTWWVE